MIMSTYEFGRSGCPFFIVIDKDWGRQISVISSLVNRKVWVIGGVCPEILSRFMF